MYNEIIISKDNLINNIKQVKKYNPNSLICAMVKANAYGVGVENVVSAIDKYVDYYGVACFFEAKNLRSCTDKKILILGSVDEIEEDFSYSCNSIDDVMKLIESGKHINLHLKINTGMNRYGFSSVKELKQAIKLIKKSNLDIEGIYTHFATADEYVNIQMDRMRKYLKILQKHNMNPIIHTDNSRVNREKNHHLDMVRIGYDLYNQDDKNFSSVVSIRSKIVDIRIVRKRALVGYDYRYVAKKKMSVAIVPIGYADGFDIRYIGMDLLVMNKKCKVLNVCMDCFMLDVSDISIKKGDDIMILDHINSLNKYADYTKTSPYQVMINFSHVRARLTTISTNSKDE